MNGFNWSPGIGDPTPLGWFTAAFYLLTAYFCWSAASTHRNRQEVEIWRWLSFFLLALGINKQLDLQTALTEGGRLIARSQGWYDNRRIVQFCFILLIAACCLTTAILLLKWTRHTTRATRLALVGFTLLLSFVVVRAASFHHFDVFIGRSVLGIRWNWILEIGGIATIFAASLVKPQNPPGERA